MHVPVCSALFCNEPRCARFLNMSGISAHSRLTYEVHMAFIRLSSFKTTADVVSSILNWVCPECGGRLGGRGKEFKCQGECQNDWRPVWEGFLSVRGWVIGSG